MKLLWKLSSVNRWKAVRSFIFFLLLYLYLWLIVDLRLIYHGAGVITNLPPFFKGWEFFSDFLSYPGGLTEYSAAFLAQFFYYSWAGAAVVTLQALMIWLCVDYFFKSINHSHLCCLRFIPPILLLAVYNQYTFHFVTITAFLVSLLFVCLYQKTTPKRQASSAAVLIVMSLILYTIAGPAFLLFAALCAIYELFFKRRLLPALVCLLSAAAVPYVLGVRIFGVSLIDAFTDLLPLSWKITSYEDRRRMIEVVYVLYLLLPLTAFGSGLWARFAPEKSRRKPRLQIFSRILSWYFQRSKVRFAVESMVLFAIAGIAIFLSYNRKIKTVFEVDYFASCRNWQKVLDTARSYPNDFSVVHAVNRALYRTGRLNRDMFSSPQHSGALLLTSGLVSANWKRFDTYIDLGHVNMAEYALNESMERYGSRPVILQRLALINMVKGNIGAAKIYLTRLSKTLFHTDWAHKYLSLIESDPTLTADDRIQQLRSLKVEKDYCFLSFASERMFLALLEKNKKNQMAFEYLMAYYLLTGKLDNFVQHLNRLDDFDYHAIPPVYEQALLLHISNTKENLNLHGRGISRQSSELYKGFTDIYNRYRGNKKAAADELAGNYGDSYLFYYAYGFSGMKK